ncbi:MAG: ribosomal-processing cysteine protease Prp [Clostridia bacterium]|nr:ribosomal-processing cysteine protease Prp [Clostridia bacterium]
MIHVYANREGARCRLFVQGHADYATGQDIVCAAVSALTGALVAFAAESPACRHLRWSVAHGELFLSCRGGLGVGFDIVMRGLRAIGEQYPENLRIEVAQGC